MLKHVELNGMDKNQKKIRPERSQIDDLEEIPKVKRKFVYECQQATPAMILTHTVFIYLLIYLVLNLLIYSYLCFFSNETMATASMIQTHDVRVTI